MEFPSQIPVEELKPCAMYDADLIAKYNALYKGGGAFREMIDQFLIKRKLEAKHPEHYTERKKRAPYTNRAGGLLDWIVAAVFRNGIAFRVDESAPDESRQYWQSLNRDANGLGTPLPALARNITLDVCLHKRAYFSIDFPSVEGRMGSVGTMDADLYRLDPQAVDDWSEEDGAIEWVRCHNVEYERGENWWKPAEVERHTWTYRTTDALAIYEAKRPKGQPWQKDAMAVRIDEQEYDSGLPVFEVRAHDGLWVMDRLADVAVALFNREAAITKYLDDGAFQMLVLSLSNPQKTELFLADLNALLLEAGDSAAWLAPQSGYFDPMHKDAQSLKDGLYEVIQSSAINAATIPQAGRLSGDAVEAMRDPLQVLLNAFAWPVVDALDRMRSALLEHRGEPEDMVRILWGGAADVTLEDARKIIEGNKNARMENSGDDSGSGAHVGASEENDEEEGDA